MVIAEKISQWVNEKFINTNCFLIEVKVSEQNARIQVLVDCDAGISIDTCVKLSRYLEHQLEAQQLDAVNYLLEVSSPGIGYPFKFHRQYVKSINRNIEVILNDDSIMEGILTNVTDTEITIVENVAKGAKPKPGGKKVKEETAPISLPFSQIKTAKEKIVF